MRAEVACFLVVALAGCGSEAPDDKINPVSAPTIPRLVSPQEALAAANIATLDPHTMNASEISKVLGEGTFCAFRYVSDGNPVLAWTPRSARPAASAVVKLNGVLVELHRNAANANAFEAGDIRLTLTSADSDDASSHEPRNAKLVFEVGERFKVGYGGYLICPNAAT